MPIVAGDHQEGIFIWNFVGKIDGAEFHRWFSEVRQLSQTSSASKIYHIMDVDQADTNFGAIMSQMLEAARQPIDQAPKAVRDNRFLFVGTNEMAKLAANLAKLPQFGGYEMPIFRTLDDALAFIRLDHTKPLRVTDNLQS